MGSYTVQHSYFLWHFTLASQAITLPSCLLPHKYAELQVVAQNPSTYTVHTLTNGQDHALGPRRGTWV